jgi:hypothetical protein
LGACSPRLLYRELSGILDILREDFAENPDARSRTI